MSAEAELVTFQDEDGREHSFEVLETTMIAGKEYLLLADPEEDEEDGQAYIMRKTGDDENNLVYEFVEDETELQSVYEVFKQLLEDEVDFTE